MKLVCLIRAVRPLSPWVIGPVNDPGLVTPGWVQGVGLEAGGPCLWALSLCVGKHAALWFIVPLVAGRGSVCAEEGVRPPYNSFVSAVSVDTPVMKNKNWINKTYFFLSGVAIRQRLPNLPPVCALWNAWFRQVCLNSGPLPVTPGGHSVVPQSRQTLKAHKSRGDRPEKWIRPKRRECNAMKVQPGSSGSKLLRDFKPRNKHPLGSEWQIYTSGPVSAHMIKT